MLAHISVESSGWTRRITPLDIARLMRISSGHDHLGARETAYDCHTAVDNHEHHAFTACSLTTSLQHEQDLFDTYRRGTRRPTTLPTKQLPPLSHAAW